MARYKIAWMPGDGVGRDVMEAARIVLYALKLDAEYQHADIGWDFWVAEGNPLPERTLQVLEQSHCALFGAVTSKPAEEAERELGPEWRGRGLTYASPIISLRQHFDLYINLRPCKAYPGNPRNLRDDVDLVVFRENTEGLYAGVEFHPVPEEVCATLRRAHPGFGRFAGLDADEYALALRVITRRGARRIVRAAFEHARRFGYPSVTVVEKANVLRLTSGLFVREARQVAAQFPGIELKETNIDTMAMWLVRSPQNYGVLVSSNLFGDILSDLCAQLVGGLGFAASANIGPSFALFEPTHGSAPRYAGQYKVNPIAMLLAARLMLEWLGEEASARRLEAAVARVVADGRVRTYDMGGEHSSLEVAEAVARAL